MINQELKSKVYRELLENGFILGEFKYDSYYEQKSEGKRALFGGKWDDNYNEKYKYLLEFFDGIPEFMIKKKEKRCNGKIIISQAE